ncbi:MAG: EAL domain-containing response regulator [Pseudomonadota bacterium]
MQTDLILDQEHTEVRDTDSFIGRGKENLKALVVENDTRLGDIVAKALEFSGFAEVRLVRRCGNAIALLDGLDPVSFDLVVCDLVLPDGDGFMVLSHLAQMGFGGRIILMSGNEGRLLDTAETQARLSGLDVSGTLRKPFSLHKLIAMAQPTDEPLFVPPARTGNFQFDLNDFDRALTEGELRARFHPVVDAHTQQVTGIEALARWIHPEYGLIPPALFMPQVEISPLSDAFLLEMLRQVLTAQQALAQAGFAVSAAVNVGSGQLTSLALTNRFVELAREYDVAPDTVVLEITETQGFGEPRAAIETLNRLRLQGFRLSVDDYGTGFSSLERLRTLPFTELKVDRQFVAGAAESGELTAILRHCVELARQFQLNTVAEGIETVEDWHLVRSLGFKDVQGFFFSQPLELDALVAWPQRRLASTGPRPGPLELTAMEQFQPHQM